jgi:hypothetical protein
MARTEEWQQDQSGMVSQLQVQVLEPGDLLPVRVETDKVLVNYSHLTDLLDEAGWTREGWSRAAPTAQE